MPNFRRSRPRRRRTTRRSRPRRRMRRRQPFGMTRRVPTGLPSSLFVVLKYSEVIKPTSTITHLQQFLANSCYKPNFTSSGHQPHYFDQYIGLYRRFIVNACGISITATNTGNDTMQIGVWPSTTNAILQDNPAELRETPNVRIMILGSKQANQVKSIRHFAREKPPPMVRVTPYE